MSFPSQVYAEQIPSNIDNRQHNVAIKPPSDNSACKAIAGVTGGLAGAAGTVGAVSTLGSVAGLGGGAAVTSGLAALGGVARGIAGGAMLTGLAAVALVPVGTATIASYAFCHEEINQSIIINNGDVINSQNKEENNNG